jgi:cell division protein FtsI/penicillin-binding protein 2
MPTFSTARAAAVLVSIGLLLSVLIGRVAYLQTYGREQTIQKADRQQHQTVTLPARRGGISDRNGMLMAGTIQTRSLFIDPKFMADSFQTEGHSLVEMDDAVAKLAKLIDKRPFELSQLLGDRATSRFLRVADNLDEPTCDAIEKLDLPGVGLQPRNARYYPMGSIGAHLLGGTGAEGGLEGLELKYEKILAGKDGSMREMKDAKRRAISVADEDYCPPQHGQHLVLTIDANIQMIAEQELAATCKQFKAARGEVVVMDPKTGDVVALANWPTFNPQNLDDSVAETRRNNALVCPYEPGSTIKPFIASPALAWSITRVNEVWPIHGPHYVTPYGRHVTDVHGYDQLAMWDVLVKSSNIGMSMLGERMGNDKLWKALAGFGFGHQTGIELPGEDPGRLNPLKVWTKYSTESIAQGYEIMVTPMQLCRAFCAFANGGRLVEPHLVKGVLDADGNVVSLRKPRDLNMMPEVINPDTASEVRRILCDVLIRGTATKARSRIYNAFGKTGTAHVSGGKEGYSESKFTSSFIGGAPYENPRLVVAFIIHEPDRAIAHYGGAVAAPGATKFFDRALAYLSVPASTDLPAPPPQIANVLYAYDAKLYKMPTGKAKTESASARE